MSYTKIWLHCVWSTKNREIIISNSFRPVLLSHIREVAQGKGILLDYINAHKDHVHALINMAGNKTLQILCNKLKGKAHFGLIK